MSTRTCSHPGCVRGYDAKGYCRVHYCQFKKHGATWDIGSEGAASHRCRAPGCTEPGDGKWYCVQHRAALARCVSRGCKERQRSAANPFCDLHARRNRTVKHFYGITLLEYEAILARQRGRCATCRRKGRLHLDHNHKTGAVRKMLCGNCNRALGLVRESPATLRAMLAYVEGR